MKFKGQCPECGEIPDIHDCFIGEGSEIMFLWFYMCACSARTRTVGVWLFRPWAAPALKS
jgi:hypothetical protein